MGARNSPWGACIAARGPGPGTESPSTSPPPVVSRMSPPLCGGRGREGGTEGRRGGKEGGERRRAEEFSKKKSESLKRLYENSLNERNFPN